MPLGHLPEQDLHALRDVIHEEGVGLDAIAVEIGDVGNRICLRSVEHALPGWRDGEGQCWTQCYSYVQRLPVARLPPTRDRQTRSDSPLPFAPLAAMIDQTAL